LDRPLTFNRQVMAAMFAPFLLDWPSHQTKQCNIEQSNIGSNTI
jgi:hypothetical protein